MKKIDSVEEVKGAGWSGETVKGNADDIATNLSNISTNASNMAILYAMYGITYVADTSAEFEAFAHVDHVNETMFVNLDAVTLTKNFIGQSGQKIIFKNRPGNPVLINGNFSFTTNSSDTDYAVASAAYNATTRAFTFAAATVSSDIYNDTSNVYAMFNGQVGSVSGASATSIVLDSTPNVDGSSSGNDKVFWTRNPLMNFSISGFVKFTGTASNFLFYGAHNIDFTGLHAILSNRFIVVGAYFKNLGYIEWDNATMNVTPANSLSSFNYMRVDGGFLAARGISVHDTGNFTALYSGGWIDGNLKVDIAGNSNTDSGEFRGLVIVGTANEFVLSGIDTRNKTSSAIDASVNVTTLI